VERGSASAAVLAERLAAHPAVRRVRYPGLADDPAHEVAGRLLDGFGAVVSFELESAAAAEAACGRVELLAHASSLGGVETVIERQGRWHAGPDVPDGLLRISVGLEHAEDLWRDLDRALAG
jgi:cystathionine gamma-synthase